MHAMTSAFIWKRTSTIGKLFAKVKHIEWEKYCQNDYMTKNIFCIRNIEVTSENITIVVILEEYINIIINAHLIL